MSRTSSPHTYSRRSSNSIDLECRVERNAPSRALLLRIFSSFRRLSSSSKVVSFSSACSMFFLTSRTRFSCSEISASMRCRLSCVLFLSARRTAVSDSHFALSPSAAERRSRACSVSISLRCMRSPIPSEEA